MSLCIGTKTRAAILTVVGSPADSAICLGSLRPLGLALTLPPLRTPSHTSSNRTDCQAGRTTSGLRESSALRLRLSPATTTKASLPACGRGRSCVPYAQAQERDYTHPLTFAVKAVPKCHCGTRRSLIAARPLLHLLSSRQP